MQNLDSMDAPVSGLPQDKQSNFESLYMKNPSQASDDSNPVQTGQSLFVPIKEEDQEVGSQKSDQKQVAPITSLKDIEIMQVDDEVKSKDAIEKKEEPVQDEAVKDVPAQDQIQINRDS